MCDKPSDAKATITGVRSVAEITQMFQPKIMLKVRSDLQQKRRPNYAWMASITSSCKELSSDPSMKGLNNTVKCFLRHLQESMKVSLRNPKRSYKLKMHVQTFLTYFYTIYWKIKKPFDHTHYRDKIAEILAMYIDLELKSSKICKKDLKSMISERICSYLFLCLDKSMEHIIDAIFKTTKFLIKSYNDICSAVIKRVLHNSQFDDYDTNYVRYLLAFKLWMKVAGKEHHQRIKKEAIYKLSPPTDFHDKLKSGKFTNILPYLPKPDRHRATTFYMQSQFDLKDKIQAFLKHFKIKEGEDELMDDSVVIIDACDDSSTPVKDELGDGDLLEKIWRKCNDDDICDDTVYIMNEIESLMYGDDDELLIEQKKDRITDSNNIPTVGIENRFLSLSRKKYNSPEKIFSLSKHYSNTETSLLIENKSLTLDLSNEDDVLSLNDRTDDVSRKEDNISGALIHSPELVLHQKPCATIGPGHCKENPLIIQNTKTTAELADSSGICEQNKDVLNNDAFFEIRETNIVAEEIVIGTETFDVSSPSFIVDADNNENIDPTVVINEIEIPIENDTSKTQSIITAEKYQKCITSNSSGHQLLPYVTSSDTVSLARRQDSYSHNDLMLTELIFSEEFLEVNGDENSDEDNRCHALKQYSRGGKLSAFREQVESKLDSGEEFVSSSPSSDRTVLEGGYINSSDSTLHLRNALEFDLKTPTLSPLKDNMDSSQHSSSQVVKRKNNESLEHLVLSDDSGCGSKTRPSEKQQSSNRSTPKSKSKKNPEVPTEIKTPVKKTTTKKRRRRRR